MSPRASRTAVAAWVCLVGGGSLPAWADPMRPLVPPVNTATPAAPVPLAGSPDYRLNKAREGEAPRDLERLVAIRQDSSQRWLALLGERWLKVGDRLDRYTVGAIDANSVQLADGLQRKTLHLLPPLSRTGPAGTPLANTSPAPGGSTDVAQADPAAQSSHRATGLSSP